MTRQIAEAMQQALRPRGVAVVCDAQHFCMMMRGVQKQNSRVITSAVLGAFRTNRATRNELMDLLKIHRPE
jgi:GTP cyclohydrolase I